MTKRENPVGRDYIIKPYLVDKKLNKKKKQPRFIAEKRFKKIENYGENLSSEWLFMETCRKGQYMERKAKTKELQCRFLHHQNPYMRLGPFKVWPKLRNSI